MASLTNAVMVTLRVRAHSHQAKAGAKAKRSKNKQKWSKNKWQTSKKIFAFASVFARCEWALNRDAWGREPTWIVCGRPTKRVLEWCFDMFHLISTHYSELATLLLSNQKCVIWRHLILVTCCQDVVCFIGIFIFSPFWHFKHKNKGFEAIKEKSLAISLKNLIPFQSQQKATGKL